jgi:methionine-gamma-lyase
MDQDSELGFSTRAIRAASRPPRVEQAPSAVPIYQTVTFATADNEELGSVLSEPTKGYAYSRIANPTATAMADALAEVEGAEDGFAFGTGMAAIHATLASLLSSGDRVVSGASLYGGTRQLLTKVFGRFGVETLAVDSTDPVAVERALAERPTRLLYLETMANPTLAVSDLSALAELGHRFGAVVVVDNTFASPYLCRPIELGVDLVVESCTKWIGGHADVMGGAVVGSAARIQAVREVQTDTGGIVSPFSAFLILRGLETLAVRMERHCASALALARFLEDQGLRVYHPGLPSHPQAAVAQRVLRAGGGMVSFELASREAAAALVDRLSIPERTASLGTIKTMAIHPPSTSHRQLDPAALAQAGIAEGLIRVSVGLEDVEDLIADFSTALEAARATVAA